MPGCSVSAEWSALYPLAFGPLWELARQGWGLLLTKVFAWIKVLTVRDRAEEPADCG
jgi:hypothetical protein